MRHKRESTDIAIVGGGICGLTTALALERRGLTPTIYEATSEYRPVGAGILLQTNALLVFDRLNIAERIRTEGVTLKDTLIQSPSGRVLKQFDIESIERSEFGYGFVSIYRADLQRVLLNELQAEVKTGKACVGVRNASTPSVRFEDGTEISPDILIGADGIASVVRNAVAPAVTPRALETVVYRAIAATNLPEHHRDVGLEVWGDGTYTGGAPIGDNRFYWFATAPERLKAGTVDTCKLRRYCSQYPEPIPSVVNAIGADDVITTGLKEVPSRDRWYRGSIVLAGDAAHGTLPFAGQGAAQAIEDGLILAHSIERYADQSTAFQTYEAMRKPRADRVRSESHTLGKLGTIQSRIGCRARNFAVELFPDTLFREFRRRRVLDASLPENELTAAEY